MPTYRTAAQIIAAADAQCRDGWHRPASDETLLEQLEIALQVAIAEKNGERGRELLKQIKEAQSV